MDVDSETINNIKEQQLRECKSEHKISLIVTGYSEDHQVKSTFYNILCTSIEGGNETRKIQRNCYKELREFNKKLKAYYGPIRLLRTFPGKHLGKKDDAHIGERMRQLQIWLSELVMDIETCEDNLVREFFHLPVVEKPDICHL